MGIYLNPGNDGFKESIRSRIYVDKTELIARTNELIGTKEKYICVSRPRRFGKSMALEMLAAYYSRGCDSGELFAGMKIRSDPSFEEHLNRYDVIYLNMQHFLIRSRKQKVTDYLEQTVVDEIRKTYGKFFAQEETILAAVLEEIYVNAGKKFIFLIDEWDCVMRERQESEDLQRQYLDFLRNLLKDQPYVAMAYMTGILPVKKYGQQSALNMFWEYSMTDQNVFEEYTGFTQDEVRELCERFDMDFDGLRADIVRMMGGAGIRVNTLSFQNDMRTFKSKDDVLTLLIHLGYLGYDAEKKEAFIPNKEIMAEFENAMSVGGWPEVMRVLRASEKLLEDTLRCDAESVAQGLDRAHREVASILTYNDENAMGAAIALAYYSARKYYKIIRELPAGLGFADVVFLPLPSCTKPALVIELKYGKTAETAIRQIKDRKYVEALEGYSGEVLLAGVSYDRDNKNKPHSCVIEKLFLTGRISQSLLQ